MKIFITICTSVIWFLTLMVAYLEGHQDGRDEWIAYTEKVEWISDCQYKGEKIRNKAECEILYLEKLKSED